MVEHDEQHAGVAVRLAQGLDHPRRAGRGEDLAGHADVEHALADEAAERRLVAAAAEGDEGDLVLGLRRRRGRRAVRR